ncbi:MAG: LamG domain-containing protein [Planctomycetes bacterium]|nr:LamG domain-containing protein [Planctomycetota bacterium]
MRRMRSGQRGGAFDVVILAASLSLSAREAEAEEDLITYWSFDSMDGATIADSIGGHDGILYGNGGIVADGVCGGALHLDDSGYVAIAPSADLSPVEENQLTIEVWVRIAYMKNPGYGYPQHYVIDLRDGTWGYGLNVDGRQIQFWIRQYGPCIDLSVLPSEPPLVPPGEWTHVVCVYDGLELRLYVNGAIAVSLPLDPGMCVLGQSISALDLGYGHCCGKESFIGEMDELKVYKRALTDEEILGHYESPCNHPPHADPGGPYVARATSWDGAWVQLHGEGWDPDGDAIIGYTWDLDPETDSEADEDTIPCNDPDVVGKDPLVFFRIGQTSIALTVFDEHEQPSYCENSETTVTISLIEVLIDIKPGSEPNSINIGSQGVVPVAFLGSNTFDASSIDPGTITLRGEDFDLGLVRLRGRKQVPMADFDDVDADGHLDLVVHLETENLSLEPADITCALGALTYDGFVVAGQDSVRIVPQE